jgi:glycosyltransferase involved in cell wall biosynthesis
MINTLETGGTERQFAVLASGLASEAFNLHLGCIRRDGPLAADFGEIPEFDLGGSLYGWKSFGARWCLSRHLRNNHVQVAHAFDFYTNLTLIPAARLARVPVVIGSHRQVGDLLTGMQFCAQTAALRACDAVVCNSLAAADRLATAGLPREKLVVIGNALPPSAFASVSAALPHRPGALRVCMVARMNAHYKNHLGFLRIAAQIHEHMPNVEFVLVGDGPGRQDLEQYAVKIGISESVTFLGERRDIPAVLASMDVAVLTSDSESLSNVILEAMAARLPVVAYDVGGNAELVDDQRGMLVDANDENAFANSVRRLLSDASLRQRLGTNAFHFVEANFSLDQVSRRYQDLYASLLDRKGRRQHTA